jgi:hypothetical protein
MRLTGFLRWLPTGPHPAFPEDVLGRLSDHPGRRHLEVDV